MATIAVFIARGGASYAATQLPKNSVGTNQLKNSAVTGAKVKNQSLGGADIDLGSLGTVPSAANASHAYQADSADHANNADSADHANNADSADHANNADSASTAGNADMLDDLNSTDFQRSGASGFDTAHTAHLFSLSGNEKDEFPVANGSFWITCKNDKYPYPFVGWDIREGS